MAGRKQESVGIITDNMHPYNLFSSNLIMDWTNNNIFIGVYVFMMGHILLNLQVLMM